MMEPYSLITLLIKKLLYIFLYNRELSCFAVLQILILWDGNNYYRMFNLPFAVSILFKTLQVLIVLVPLSVLVFIFILFFCRKTTQWGHGFYATFSNLLGMKVAKTYWQDCALYWDVYIICNVLILFLINCALTDNEFISMFGVTQKWSCWVICFVWNNWPSASEFSRVALS
jgi:hypothetical protein